MIQFVRLGAAAVMSAWLGAALAAPEETVLETRLVDARAVRVKIEGLVDLKLTQGAVPTLTIIGERGLVTKLTTSQQGDTITIATEGKGFKLGRKSNGVRAELTLPELREVLSDSVGTTEVNGFSGDEIDLKLDGAGAMKVNCNYRVVNAVLGGLGSMHIAGANSEGIDLNLRGAGVITLHGASKWLKASLGGLGSLNAQPFVVDTVSLDLSGLGNASVTARRNANLNVSGLGSVTVYGKPLNRSVTVDGLGKVNWK